MARVELIHAMTNTQLDKNQEYAKERLEDNPDQGWQQLIELIDLERQYRSKLDEYYAEVQKNWSGPTSHRKG